MRPDDYLFDTICALDDAADALDALGYDLDATMVRDLSDRLKGDVVLVLRNPDAGKAPD